MDEKGEKEENSKPSSTTENFVAFSDEISNMSFPFSPPFSSIFDMMSPLPPSLCDDLEVSDFSGFMDMLSLPDYTSSLIDWHQNIVTTSAPPPPEITQPVQSLPSPNAPNSFEVVNTPVSLNSLPILSPPNEVTDKATESKNEAKDETMNGDKGEENNDQDKIKNQLKPKKRMRNQKKKESRVAFMTRSEVDHLEDGFRWRKYGQKDLKNSAHPRSYYRCTFPNCGVKKRVERSTDDPSVVMTTYEGTHAHPSTVPLDTTKVGLVQKGSASASASEVASANYALRQQHLQRQQELEQQALAAAALYNSTSTSPLNVVNASSCINFGNISATFLHNHNHNQQHNRHQPFLPSTLPNNPHALFRDNGGLLQDIIMPSLIRNGDRL